MGLFDAFKRRFKEIDSSHIRTVIEHRGSYGYGHDFSGLDKLCPYEIVMIEMRENPPKIVNGIERKTWNSKIFAIREKLTGRVIKEIDYKYFKHGIDAFSPFIWEGEWHAFIPDTYLKSEVINLETGEVRAVTANDNKYSWCPVNYYVPCFYRDPKERISEYTEKSGEKRAISFNPTATDYEISGWLADDSMKPENIKDLVYLNICFVAGTFWAADYEWLVYKMDLPTIMASGIIPMPDRDHYCFEFDYSAPPELRQYLKMNGPDDRDNATFNRFEFYTQGFTNGFNRSEK